MKQIPLTQGKVALVDDADYERLAQYKWSFFVGYAARPVGRRLVFMHRCIMNTPPGKETDHINGDKLDNQRANLRICTRAQNSQNQRRQAGRSSVYRGVARHSKGKGWQAHIRIDGHLCYIGLFASEADAARAYDTRAAAAWGEYARLNFPGGALGASSMSTE